MRRTARSILLLLTVAVVAPWALAQTKAGSNAEQRTSHYLDSVRQQPSLLLAFLRDMPKGGDLHNHLAGAIYAESMIDFAVQDGLCIDRATLFLAPAPCDAACGPHGTKPAVSCGYRDPALYNSIVDAWSMRNWHPGEGSGHDHFFASFDKFFASTLNHVGDSIAEASARAAQDHLQYLELMHTAGGLRSAELGTRLGWDDDFARMRQKLLAGGLPEIIATTRKELDADEAKSQLLLKCGTPVADPGCNVTVRYLYQVLRGLPREQVFAQILMGFELAQTDPRFVGFNLVMPEDWYVPMHDFELHMRIIDYLHGVYPKIHISLHADELAMGLVPPEGLRFHIRDSIEIGHAERIGHGVAVMNERDPLGLLHEMAQRQVLVEICLTSNDGILGVRGKDHPLPIYMKYGVPVALATDDEGVSRSDMTHEYLRAVQTYDLSYADLKRMARQSEEHGFLPGASLWADTKTFRPVAACAADSPDAGRFSAGCTTYLDQNQRAREQWKLEREFTVFEKRVASSE